MHKNFLHKNYTSTKYQLSIRFCIHCYVHYIYPWLWHKPSVALKIHQLPAMELFALDEEIRGCDVGFVLLVQTLLLWLLPEKY